jgi:hypothetical protein
MRIKHAVIVDYPEEITRARWQADRRMPGGRELVLSIRDFQAREVMLLLSEPAVRSLQEMLAAIVIPTDGFPAPPVARAEGRWPADGVRVRLAIWVQDPSEVNRPCWRDHELVVSIGGAVIFHMAEPAAIRLLEVLAAAGGRHIDDQGAVR